MDPVHLPAALLDEHISRRTSEPRAVSLISTPSSWNFRAPPHVDRPPSPAGLSEKQKQFLTWCTRQQEKLAKSVLDLSETVDKLARGRLSPTRRTSQSRNSPVP